MEAKGEGFIGENGSMPATNGSATKRKAGDMGGGAKSETPTKRIKSDEEEDEDDDDGDEDG